MSDSTLNLSDPRSLQGDRRTPLMPFGNGKMRVALIVLGGVASFLSSVGAASWIAEREAGREIDKAVAVIEERQSNQYGEVMRAIRELREDIRALDSKQ